MVQRASEMVAMQVILHVLAMFQVAVVGALVTAVMEALEVPDRIQRQPPAPAIAAPVGVSDCMVKDQVALVVSTRLKAFQ
jgi:precorrin isomerase